MGVSQLGYLVIASVTPASIGVSLHTVIRELKEPTPCLHPRVSTVPWVKLAGLQGPILWSQHKEHGLSAGLCYLAPDPPATPQEGACSYPISQRHQGPQLDKA